MPLQKTAIALSSELLARVDKIARSRNESRNQFVTLILEEAVRARRDAAITQRLNEIFAEPSLVCEQVETADAWDSVGTAWNDESW